MDGLGLDDPDSGSAWFTQNDLVELENAYFALSFLERVNRYETNQTASGASNQMGFVKAAWQFLNRDIKSVIAGWSRYEETTAINEYEIYALNLF